MEYKYIVQSLAGILLASSIFGCQHPENYRWAGSAQFVTEPNVDQAIYEAKLATGVDWNQPNITVYAFPTPPLPPKDPGSLTIKDLSDRGQATFIDRLTRKGAKPDEIRAALAKPITTAPGSTADSNILTKKELYRFDRTLVATVTKGLAEKPGDRLIWTWILIKPKNFEFTGYTIVATDNETLNIEHIQNQTTTQIQGQVGATVPGPAKISPSVTGSISNQYATAADIFQQYEKLGADIFPRFLRVYRESERNQDVTGNTLISVSMLADPKFLFLPVKPDSVIVGSNLTITKDGVLLSPKKASLDVELIKDPPHCPLQAQVRLIYEIRRITSNERSYVEGEQKVSIEQHATPWHIVELVSADDVVPAEFGIFDANRIGIFAKVPTGENLPLAFADYDTARAMANWMNAQHASRIGTKGIQLTLGGTPIRNPYPLLHAEVIGDERSPQEQQKICDAIRFSDQTGHNATASP